MLVNILILEEIFMFRHFIFFILVSTSLLFPAFGMSFPDEDDQGNPRAQQTIDAEKGLILSEEDRESLKSLFDDREEDAKLPLKIKELGKLKEALISQKNTLADNEEKIEKLTTLLAQDLCHFQHKKNQKVLKLVQEKIQRRQENIKGIQKKVAHLEDDIAEAQIKIVNEICTDIPEDKDILRQYYNGEVYKAKVQAINPRLEHALNQLPSHIFHSIFSFQLEHNLNSLPSGIFQVFFPTGKSEDEISVHANPIMFLPDIWKMRRVSKKWKLEAENFIIKEKLLNKLTLMPKDFDNNNNLPTVLPTIIELFSLTDICLKNWDEASFEKFPELFSQLESSKLKALRYIWYGETTNPSLGVEGAFHLAQCFKFLSDLKELQIRSFLGEEGGKSVVSSLYRLTKLKKLSVSESQMGPAAVKIMAEDLIYIPDLEELVLPGSHPGDVGALALAENLKWVPKLRSLNLSGVFQVDPNKTSNEIHQSGIVKLAEACKNHPSIVSLNVKGHETNGLGILYNLKNINGKEITVWKD